MLISMVVACTNASGEPDLFCCDVETTQLSYEEQREVVPNLNDGHSGNTFGCACALAFAYLDCPENVPKMHGALSPLVGSDE